MIKAIIAAAAALGLLLYWFFSAKRKNSARRDAVRKISATTGSYMEEYGPETAVLDGTGLPMFLEAVKGVGRNMLRFTDEDSGVYYFFDYAFLSGDGGAKTECTAALFELKKDGLPPFFLSCDGSGAQPSMAGFDPVDMRTVQGLPQGARLYSSDPAKTTALLSPEKTSALSADHAWNVQASGRWLLLYKAGYVAPMGSYHAFMDSARKLAWVLAA